MPCGLCLAYLPRSLSSGPRLTAPGAAVSLRRHSRKVGTNVVLSRTLALFIFIFSLSLVGVYRHASLHTNVPSLLRKKADVPCQRLGDLPSAGSLLSLAKGNFEEIHPGFSRSMGHSLAIINLSLPPQCGVLVVIHSIPQPSGRACPSSETGDAFWAGDRLWKPSACPRLVHGFWHRQAREAALTLPSSHPPPPAWRVPSGQAFLQGM